MPFASLGFVVLAALGCGASVPIRTERTAAGACPADSVCFNVVTAGGGKAGPADLVLAWTTSGDTPIGRHLLLQLNGDEQGIRVPRSAIPGPPESALYETAYVVVLPRGQGMTARLKASTGAAQMMFVHVERPAELDGYARERFVDGAATGIAPYLLQRRGMFDRFVLAPPGQVFELVVCPATEPNCDFPIPNPT